MLLKTIWAERTLPYELKQAHFEQYAYGIPKTFPSCTLGVREIDGEKRMPLETVQAERALPNVHITGSFSFFLILVGVWRR